MLCKLFSLRCLFRVAAGFTCAWFIRICLLPYDIVIFNSDILFSVSTVSTLFVGSSWSILLNELKNPFLDLNLVNYLYHVWYKVPMGPVSDKLNSSSIFCNSAGGGGSGAGAATPANVSSTNNPMSINHILNPPHPDEGPMNNPVQQTVVISDGVTLVGGRYHIADPLGIGARGYKNGSTWYIDNKPYAHNNQPYAGNISKALQHSYESTSSNDKPQFDPVADAYFNEFMKREHVKTHELGDGLDRRYRKNTNVIRDELKKV